MVHRWSQHAKDMGVPPIPVAKCGDFTPMPDVAVYAVLTIPVICRCCMFKIAHGATLTAHWDLRALWVDGVACTA